MPFHDCSFTKTVTVSPYPVPLTPKLIALFRRFASHYLEYKIPMKTSRVIAKFGIVEQNKKHCTEYNNWSQLRHHGLIRSAHEKWSLTKRGEDFYLGKIEIYSIAGAWRSESFGDTMAEDDPAWQNWTSTQGQNRRLVTIDDIAPPDHQPEHDEFAELRYSASHS